MLTWCNITSHYTVLKSQSFFALGNLGLIVMFMVPFVLSFFIKKNNPLKLTYTATFVAYGATMFVNFIKCYNSYLSRGYFGGMHSRYYYCLIPIFALLVCEKFQEDWAAKLAEKWQLFSKCFAQNAYNFAWLGFAALLVYDDFLMFLKVNTFYF